VPTYETYPVNDHSPVDHGIIISLTYAKGEQGVTVLGPYTEAQALVELATFARVGTIEIDVTKALVMEVSEREVMVIHDSFFSTWSARAVVATYVNGAS
jgi:hypothetical protein